MKRLPIYISLLLLLTCAKEDSQDPGTTPSNIVPKYTLTASAGDGGSVSTLGGSYNKGTQISITATPSSGYRFTGWSNGSSNNPITVTLNSNTSITANFEQIPVYSISVSAEEGGSVSSQGGDYSEGTQVTITATPDEGYEFSGWSDGNTEATRVITASEDVTLTATFTELEYSYQLTVTSTEGGSISSEGGEYNEGTEVTITATADEGYRFIGWSNGSEEESITITINKDISIEALFELIPKFSISVIASEGGTVSTNGGQYEQGSEISISATPNGCYNFLQWSDGSTDQERTIIAEEDTQLTAQFISLTNEIEYSLVKLRYPCAYSISLNKPYNETSKYKVGPSAWFSASAQESYNEYYYPTNEDYNPPGYYFIDPHNFATGDFNNDGLEDLVITWATFTHTLERNSRYNYSILINNGDGSMTYNHEAFKSSSAHYNHFAYRTKVADFNNDGILDIISASMGVIQRLPGQDPYTRWERIPLMFGLGNGEFYDASTNIEGQEDGVSPPVGHSFGHELDIGDVDGDGDVDIYTGKILLLNDGNGFFQNATNELINPLKPNRNIWSSVVADFNNDGIEDFFVPYAEPFTYSDHLSYSGFYSLSVNNNPSYNNSKTGFVSEAKYGISNSKFNYAIDYDINLDGYKDIIIAVTRADPYYVGKGLQVFLNVEDTENGNRKFVSGDHLLPDESILDQYHGEGQLSVLDINNDGILDIAHTTGAGNDEYGLSFYINNGGSLQLLSLDDFAYLGREQFPGRESWGNDDKLLSRAIPINLDNTGWIDYISFVSLWSSDSGSEQVLYSVLAKD